MMPIKDKALDLAALMETNRRKVLLVHEGWQFPTDTIGGVIYHRAVSPSGWMSLIDLEATSQEWAINKAWEFRNSGSAAQFELAEWLRTSGEGAGITWDKTQDNFCASVFVKAGHPKEAYGSSPSEAVANWKARWGVKLANE